MRMLRNEENWRGQQTAASVNMKNKRIRRRYYAKSTSVSRLKTKNPVENKSMTGTMSALSQTDYIERKNVR